MPATPEDRESRRQRSPRRAPVTDREQTLSTRPWEDQGEPAARRVRPDVVLECGWGRLLFGQTFADHERLIAEVAREEPGRRDICMYVREPHVAVAKAPQELFIDPSHTYRLWLHTLRGDRDPVRGIVVRKMASAADADAVNRIYAETGMVTAPTEVLWRNQLTQTFTYLVAEDQRTGAVIGTVTGVDHTVAFDDPEGGTSLWCLAVDPQTTRPGVGRALVRTLAERYQGRSRSYLDLSVVHDNQPAIRLYEQLGFVRVPVFAVKRKNPINERLFAAAPAEAIADLNPYARLLADEALRRGITVQVTDAESGLLKLSHGGRVVHTRESLSELTTAVAMSRCDDKRLTRRLLADAGLEVPAGRLATHDGEDLAFLAEHGQIVVKPARGEQGQGISVGIRSEEELVHAIALAERFCPDVVLERFVPGDDLRIVVIDHEVVAAAIRLPARVTGTGRHTIAELIAATSRRRAAATGGESTIPLDEETTRTVEDAGHDLEDVLPAGVELTVRRTANLHTGGTIHDVTEGLHPELAAAAVRASEVLDIPVVGLDLLVPDVTRPEHVFIEANERPGLANHEPQPTAERFVDLLFPGTRPLPRGWRPGGGVDHRPTGSHEPPSRGDGPHQQGTEGD
ncbi:MAG: N-acetylglutaminylglutamine synthetase [Nitriliruptoraceae bacterium]